jgi:hypothetical protein
LDYPFGLKSSLTRSNSAHHGTNWSFEAYGSKRKLNRGVLVQTVTPSLHPSRKAFGLFCLPKLFAIML